MPESYLQRIWVPNQRKIGGPPSNGGFPFLVPRGTGATGREIPHRDQFGRRRISAWFSSADVRISREARFVFVCLEAGPQCGSSSEPASRSMPSSTWVRRLLGLDLTLQFFRYRLGGGGLGHETSKSRPKGRPVPIRTHLSLRRGHCEIHHKALPAKPCRARAPETKVCACTRTRSSKEFEP